jgi:hypothetical protein
MLVDAPVDFVVSGALKVPLCFGAAVDKPLRGGLLLGLTPFGPFPLVTKVDDGAHGGKLNETEWLADRAAPGRRRPGQSSSTTRVRQDRIIASGEFRPGAGHEVVIGQPAAR